MRDALFGSSMPPQRVRNTASLTTPAPLQSPAVLAHDSPYYASPNLVPKRLQFLGDRKGPRGPGLGLVQGHKSQILPL